MPRLRFAALIFAAVAGAGCSTSSAAPDDAGTGTDDAPVVSCGTDPRVDTYTANMTKTSKSGAVKVTLVLSDPGPPTHGTNTWTLKVTDGAGVALVSPTVAVTPFMPDHGHGTSVRAVVTAQPDGTYSVTPLYLFMAGVWRVTIDVNVGDAAAPESVAFFFCVAG